MHAVYQARGRQTKTVPLPGPRAPRTAGLRNQRRYLSDGQQPQGQQPGKQLPASQQAQPHEHAARRRLPGLPEADTGYSLVQPGQPVAGVVRALNRLQQPSPAQSHGQQPGKQLPVAQQSTHPQHSPTLAAAVTGVRARA
jgi:hypothetical protein